MGLQRIWERAKDRVAKLAARKAANDALATRTAHLPQAPIQPAQPMETDVERFVWRVVCDIYVRAIANATGRRANAISPDERAALAYTVRSSVEIDVRLIMSAIETARVEREVFLRSALHQVEGIDHEMVDQGLSDAIVRAEARKG